MNEEKENIGIVFDYTAYKLQDMIEHERDPIQKDILFSFLELYSLGVVEIKWQEGFPHAEFVVN
tara:strand:+ start:680 stop:871 length:192 start_codon:yes stop_codon:yes gene_type:complete